MAHPIHCDPRTLLKQLAIPLVQRLFEQRGELLDLPWSELRQKKQVAPIYAAWQRLPEDRRREVQIVFHEIAGAATELGIAAFAQEVKHAAPGDVWKFNACRSRLNKALWFYLSFPELFERATLFARADSLTTGRFAIRRDDLPRAPIIAVEKNVQALIDAVEHLDESWHAVIIGPQYVPLERLGPRVHLLPAQRRIGNWLGIADVLCHPSDYESHCFSINEAWLAGVPVVSYDYLVNRQFEERHGPLMWLVTTRPEPARLAAAIGESYAGRNDPRVARAREVASREYAAPVMGRRWSDLCQHVLYGRMA